MQDLELMSKDECIAEYKSSKLYVYNEPLMPLYLLNTKHMQGWLEQRAIDRHRTNSRLLKKALRIESGEDIAAALKFNAATITDTYWVRLPGEELTYEAVRFKENYFDMLALKGDPDSFNLKPSRTPELTNTGSFEKCWRLIDSSWWMYKSENDLEQFSELFSYYLAQQLNIPAAVYEKDGAYVRTLDFTGGASVNFETACGIIGTESDYFKIYKLLHNLDNKAAEAYIDMTFFDSLIFNMDRHENNFGILRNVDNGQILGLAPLFDHNIALISRGFPGDITRKNDRLIADFIEFHKAADIYYKLPYLDEAMVNTAVKKALNCFNKANSLPENTGSYVKEFIMNGYKIIREALF